MGVAGVVLNAMVLLLQLLLLLQLRKLLASPVIGIGFVLASGWSHYCACLGAFVNMGLSFFPGI